MKLNLVVLAIVSISCSTPPVAPVETIPVEAIASIHQIPEDCFDVEMEVWFAAFNKYQDSGHDMASADVKAREDATRSYADCAETAPDRLIMRAKE